MTEITVFHNNRIEKCKSSIQLCENEFNEQKQKIANIKQKLIKIIAKETIATRIKTSRINELIEHNGYDDGEVIKLTDKYLEDHYRYIYDEVQIVFDLEVKRKLLEHEYKNEREYCKILELTIEEKNQELIDLTKKTIEEITIDYRQTEKWSLFD